MWCSDSSVSCTGKTICPWGQISEDKLVFVVFIPESRGVETQCAAPRNYLCEVSCLPQRRIRLVPPGSPHPLSKTQSKGRSATKKSQSRVRFDLADGTWGELPALVVLQGKKWHFVNPSAKSSLSPQRYTSPTL